MDRGAAGKSARAGQAALSKQERGQKMIASTENRLDATYKEIGRQNVELARLRAALMKICDVVGTSTEAHLIARTALGEGVRDET